MLNIWIINGPNLNLLGKRQTNIYGLQKLVDIEKECIHLSNKLDINIEFFQFNCEGKIIEKIHKARTIVQGIIINPAAYTHTSIAIADALVCFDGKIIEVHLSNIYNRESYRHHSYISPHVEGIISGLGIQGYICALHAMQKLLR